MIYMKKKNEDFLVVQEQKLGTTGLGGLGGLGNLGGLGGLGGLGTARA